MEKMNKERMDKRIDGWTSLLYYLNLETKEKMDDGPRVMKEKQQHSIN